MNALENQLLLTQRILALCYELVAQPNFATVLHRTVQATAELVESETAGLWLWDEQSHLLRLSAKALAPDRLFDFALPQNNTLAAQALNNKTPLILQDTRADRSYIDEVANALDYKAHGLILVPLYFQDRKVGLLAAVNKTKARQFDGSDATALRLWGKHAAAAIQNTRLLEHYQHQAQAESSQRKLAEALSAASAALASTLDYDQVLDEILEQIQLVIPCNTCNVMMIESHNIARVFRGTGYDKYGTAETLGETTLHVDHVAGLRQMRETLKPVVVPNVAQDPTWVYSRPEHQWIRAYVGVPIVVHDQVVGFLNAMSATPYHYTEMHAERLQSFAHHAATAIENARLYRKAQQEIAERIKVETELLRHRDHLEELVRERTAEIHRLAITDDLTGLHNRRHWLTLAEQALAQAQRYHHPLSILLLDVDHFKQINDTYGHAAGDKALRQVAAQLRIDTRQADILGRYGGEEFIVLMPRIEAHAAVQAAVRLLENLRALQIQTDSAVIHLSASIGIVELDHTQKQNIDALISLADRAMYVAKQSGRNRIFAPGFAETT